jgi:hypothetical protein
MGRYSDYNEVREKDHWDTIDQRAIPQVFKDMIRGKYYAEPCCGSGKLELLLRNCGAICLWASDIRDNPWCVRDALELTKEDLSGCDLIITNPPFSWSLLKPLLDHLPTLKPAWLLLPVQKTHNDYMTSYMKRCSEIISIGRLYWVDKGPEHKNVRGKEDFCWCLFHDTEQVTRFWSKR